MEQSGVHGGSLLGDEFLKVKDLCVDLSPTQSAALYEVGKVGGLSESVHEGDILLAVLAHPKPIEVEAVIDRGDLLWSLAWVFEELGVAL